MSMPSLADCDRTTIRWVTDPGPKFIFRLHIWIANGVCQLCGRAFNATKEQPVIVLENSKDAPDIALKVAEHILRGRTCVADIYGYRSDLIVRGCDPLMLTLQAPDGPLFRTEAKYVRSVTVR